MTKAAQSQEKILAMNEALVLGSLRQHELAEAAGTLNVQLQKEITERKAAEELLRRNHVTFFNLIENAPFGLYVVDAQFCLRQVSSASQKAFSSVRPLIGRDFEEVVRITWPDPFASEVLGRFRYTLETGKPYAAPNTTQQRLDTTDIESYDWKIERITLPDGQFGVVCYFYDITERKQAEERQQFLMNELAHRGGNLLAVIQSIVIRSLSGTRPLADERQTLSKRLLALARSQSALMKEGFIGASVAEILRLEFEGFSDQVVAVGPDVLLNSRAAQTFALLAHELATNAAKYGALSGPEKGQINIVWSVEGDGKEARFKFEWKESGGPSVVSPTRKGFGSVVTEKVVAQDFKAQPTVKFAPEGFSYEIDAPLNVITAKSAGNLISA